LCLSPAELAETDMADHAIAALSASRVRDVSILGRRGPVQAAFTTVEVRELGEMTEAEPVVKPEECEIDPISAEELSTARAATKQKVEIVQGYSRLAPAGKPRRIHLRFFVSPQEILGDADGRVRGIRLAKTQLTKNEADGVVAEPTGETEELPCELV